MLGWLVEDKSIEPHVPVWERYARKDETSTVSAFVWDEKANEYRCPGGKALRNEWRPFTHARTHITKGDTNIYRFSEAG